jgi:hypothetical protein
MSAPDKSRQRTGKTARQWQPGQSGNPTGRPPGTGAIQKLREEIGAHIPGIIEQLVAQAKGGDVGAARLLLERVVPPVKAVEQPQAIDLPTDGDLTAKGHAVLQAAADGLITATQAASLMTALGSLARVVEVDGLLKRIEALEAQSRPI